MTAVPSSTVEALTPCGNLHTTLATDPETNTPIKMFCALGRSGSCAAANIEALSRVINLCIASGVAVDKIGATLDGISCAHDQGDWDGAKRTCVACIGKILMQAGNGGLVS